MGGDFQQNLNEHNRGLLTSRYVSGLGTIYTGDAVNTGMNDWIGSLS